MCTGLEIAYAVGAAATVAGTALSYSAAQDQKADAEATAATQRAQAQIDANYAASEAELQARTIRKAGDRQRAEARAALAGSGVVVGEGTAEQIDKEIQTNVEEDALMAIYDGRNRSQSILQGGRIAASRSENQARAAGYAATGSALSGINTVASGWATAAKKKG